MKIMKDKCSLVWNGIGMLNNGKTNLMVSTCTEKGYALYGGVKLIEHAMKIVARLPER